MKSRRPSRTDLRIIAAGAELLGSGRPATIAGVTTRGPDQRARLPAGRMPAPPPGRAPDIAAVAAPYLRWVERAIDAHPRLDRSGKRGQASRAELVIRGTAVELAITAWHVDRQVRVEGAGSTLATAVIQLERALGDY